MKKLKIRQFGIGTLMKYSPLVSSDSKYLFTIGDQCVYVWISKTGECLRLINQFSDSNEPLVIVGMAINPNNRLQLCVGQQNGIINIWDYEDGILIHTIKLDTELNGIYSINNNGLYLITKNTKNVYALQKIESVRHNCSPIVLFDRLPCLPVSISFDQKGELSAFHNTDGTIIYLLNLSNNQLKMLKMKKKNLSYHDKITCLQIHPQQQCLAFGTQSGRIALWYNYLNPTNPNETTISYLHWHSLPVICLAFSYDGSYLLSGGHECVLVKWIYSRSEPTFRPRLGAPIIHLTASNDQTFYVTTHSDNSLHLIGSNLAIQQTIAGVNHTFTQQQQSLPAGLHLFLRQNSIVMNSGKPGFLQFMSIENGKLIYNLDIVGENYVSPHDITDKCIFTDIKCVSIDPTDTWLVTFEERSNNSTNTEDHLNERKLRFWLFNQTNNQFELSTSVTYPHGQQTINQMLFHPNRLELATTGNDGFLKIWTFIQENPQTKRVSHWRCLSGHTHRSYSSVALSYYKSSLTERVHLLCSFEHIVTEWTSLIDNESAYEYSHCFIHFDRTNPVEHIIHANNQIFVIHKTLVNLWNTSSRQFIKSFSWNIHSFTLHPTLNYIALFEKSFLHFYSFADGKCLSRKNTLFRRVQSCLFIPFENQSSSFAPLKDSKLIFYIPEQGLKTIIDDDDDSSMNTSHQKDDEQSLALNDASMKSKEQRTILADLIRQSQHNDQHVIDKTQNRFDDLTKLNKSIHNLNQQFLTTPAYLLPSIDHYCINSLKQMLLPVDHQDENENQLEKKTDFNEEKSFDRLSTMSVESEEI